MSCCACSAGTISICVTTTRASPPFALLHPLNCEAVRLIDFQSFLFVFLPFCFSFSFLVRLFFFALLLGFRPRLQPCLSLLSPSDASSSLPIPQSRHPTSLDLPSFLLRTAVPCPPAAPLSCPGPLGPSPVSVPCKAGLTVPSPAVAIGSSSTMGRACSRQILLHLRPNQETRLCVLTGMQVDHGIHVKS